MFQSETQVVMRGHEGSSIENSGTHMSATTAWLGFAASCQLISSLSALCSMF